MAETSHDLRIAMATTDAEREQIYRFRYEVYVARLGRRSPDADDARRVLREEIDAESTLIFATVGGRMVGVARSTFGNSSLSRTHLATVFALDRFRRYPLGRLTISSRLMVDPDWRGVDIGGRLIAFLYELYREADALFDFCHCRAALVPYYENVGHRRYLLPFQHPDAGSQEPMVLALQDTVHLERVGSPLLPLAVAQPHNDVESGRWLVRKFALGAAMPTARSQTVAGGL